MATVTVEATDTVLDVTVHDDGAGGADLARGTGLLGLKDRVEALGGHIRLDSPPGAGTTLHAQIPLSTTAHQADVPIAAIAKAAGITRQTVYNWSHAYDSRGGSLAVSDHTSLGDLPTQRSRATKGAAVLVLTRSRFPSGRPKWDGHIGKAVMYAGDMLGVTVPGKIVDIIAHSWALIGDADGDGPRPHPGDRVICLPPDGEQAAPLAEHPRPRPVVRVHRGGRAVPFPGPAEPIKDALRCSDFRDLYLGRVSPST